MPKRLTSEAPRVRKAQLAKLKVVQLELKSVLPYLTADLDAETKRETITTLRSASEKLAGIARWLETQGQKPGNPTATPSRPVGVVNG